VYELIGCGSFLSMWVALKLGRTTAYHWLSLIHRPSSSIGNTDFRNKNKSAKSGEGSVHSSKPGSTYANVVRTWLGTFRPRSVSSASLHRVAETCAAPYVIEKYVTARNLQAASKYPRHRNSAFSWYHAT